MVGTSGTGRAAAGQLTHGPEWRPPVVQRGARRRCWRVCYRPGWGGVRKATLPACPPTRSLMGGSKVTWCAATPRAAGKDGSWLVPWEGRGRSGACSQTKQDAHRSRAVTERRTCPPCPHRFLPRPVNVLRALRGPTASHGALLPLSPGHLPSGCPPQSSSWPLFCALPCLDRPQSQHPLNPVTPTCPRVCLPPGRTDSHTCSGGLAPSRCPGPVCKATA